MNPDFSDKAIQQAIELFSRNHEVEHIRRFRGQRGMWSDQLNGYKRICIVGGGTAGYFAALAFRTHMPHIEVTLLESSKIPIIGVGEATIPWMVTFLHRFLDIDIHRFYREVKPTWKQGIKFDWGQPGDYHFQAPFDWGDNNVGVLGSLHEASDINAMTVQSSLMERDLTPIFKIPGGRYLSLLPRIPYAYHLDNRRLVRFLHQVAVERGVQCLDRTIQEVEVTPDGEEVHALLTDQGERLDFDLYIDCSGFRSLLLEQKLGSRFISYESSLITDQALVFNVEHGGKIKPYTTAKTMKSGWSWIIPQVEDDHNGYVHCSAFCSESEAAREIEETFPGAKIGNLVRFRSGRHEETWKGNVVAVGNAYGFVEPLESSGLLMISSVIHSLIENFPATKTDQAARRLLNTSQGKYWDGLRWFLSVHYKFNQKLDTPFWKEVREKTDISGAQPLLDCYHDLAPLHFRFPMAKLALNAVMDIVFYGLEGFDCVLLGQKVPARLYPRTEEPSSWQQRKDTLSQFLAFAVPMEEALRILEEHPELLDEFVQGPDSWLISDHRGSNS